MTNHTENYPPCICPEPTQTSTDFRFETTPSFYISLPYTPDPSELETISSMNMTSSTNENIWVDAPKTLEDITMMATSFPSAFTAGGEEPMAPSTLRHSFVQSVSDSVQDSTTSFVILSKRNLDPSFINETPKKIGSIENSSNTITLAPNFKYWGEPTKTKGAGRFASYSSSSSTAAIKGCMKDSIETEARQNIVDAIFDLQVNIQPHPEVHTEQAAAQQTFRSHPTHRPRPVIDLTELEGDYVLVPPSILL